MQVGFSPPFFGFNQNMDRHLQDSLACLIPGYRDDSDKAITSISLQELEKILSQIGKLDIKPQERISLCAKMAKGGERHAEILAKNFDKLGLEGVSLSERAELLETIINCGTPKFFRYFDKFGLTPFECLEVCKRLGGESTGWLTMYLCTNFNWIDLALEDRIALSLAIVERNNGKDLWHFCNHFERFGLDEAEGSIHLSICMNIIAKKGGARALVENLYKFNFLGIGAYDILMLGHELACQDQLVAEEFVHYLISTRILDKLEATNRLDLLLQIGAKGEGMGHILALAFDSLGLFNDISEFSDIAERFAYFKKFASMSNSLGAVLIQNIDKFGLEGVKVSERLEFFHQLLFNGTLNGKYTAPGQNLIAKVFCKELKNLGIENANEGEVLEFYRAVSPKLIRPDHIEFIRNLEELRPFGEDISPRLPLYKAIASAGGLWVVGLINTLNIIPVPYSERRQLFLEILANIHEFPSDPHLIMWNYLTEIHPLVSLLSLHEEEAASIDYEEVENFINATPKLQFLQPIFEESKKTEQALFQLAKWIAYSAGVLYDLEEDRISAIKESDALSDIFHHCNPTNRYMFLRQLSLLSKDNLRKIPNKEKDKKWSKLSWILLTRMKENGFPEEKVSELIHQINNTNCFKDTKRFDHLVQLLFLIIENGPYSPSEMEQINQTLLNILNKEASKKMKQNPKGPIKKQGELISNNLLSLRSIFTIYGREGFLNFLNSDLEIDTFLMKKFKSLFEVEEVENFGERFFETFGSFRSPTALYTYLSSVKKLPVDEKLQVLEVLNTYVNAVLQGNFPHARYDCGTSAHLYKLFEGNEKLKELWVSNGEEEILASSEASLSLETDYKKFFLQKIFTDSHLNPEDFPKLADYLQVQLEGKKMEKVENEAIEQLENLAISLCEGKLAAEEFVNKVNKLKIPLGEFQNDLENLTAKLSSGAFLIKESDDPCDLLLIGTEGQGSCQRVDGDPHYNKCLAAYLMNGEIKPIVVKKNGKIAARAMLRLMLDDQKPVLLIERIYSNTNDTVISDAIINKAIGKAKALGVSLVSKEVGNGKPYQGSLRFLGGFAPFTYSDASGGVMEGSFNTTGTKILYSP